MSHYEVVQAEGIQMHHFACLNSLGLAVGLSRVDLLSSLLDLLQHGVVVERWFGNDGCGLAVEGDIERLDT
jgi:hypothetical protein